MIKKSRISVYLLMSFLLFLTVSGTYVNNSLALDISESSSYYDAIADTLFEQEPTNPTQILRYRMLAENPNLMEDQQSVKQSVILAEEDVGNPKSFYIIESFLVSPYTYVLEPATMLAKGANCYIYVLDDVIDSYGESSATSKAVLWKNEFENKIYPNDILYFGSPDGNLGDIDGDAHVTVLLASFDGGVAGYFDMRNEVDTFNSNKREMVYVDYLATYGVLAHEFQHLIHYNYDVNERWWLDEGCAEYAKFLSGYDVSDNLTAFARDYFAHYPDDSLLYWNYMSEGGRDVRIDYGSAYTFIFYLAEKYGINAIKNLVSQTSVGAGSIEDALSTVGVTIDFNDLFLNWATALYVDDTSFGGGLFGFDNLDMSMDYDLVTTYPVTKVNRLNRYYGIYAAKLDSPLDKMMLETASTSGKYLGISIAIHDLSGWTVEKSVQIGSITEFINGTIIDEAYLITSVMDASTPYVSANAQFTVGTAYEVDYSLAAGEPLFVDSHTFSYDGGSWDFSLTNVVISDENDTEITDGSGVEVYAQFRYEGSSIVYESISMNYSIPLDWYLELSLQSFDEDNYDLYVIASSTSQYGRELIDAITIAHLLTVDEPEVSLNEDSTGLYVNVNASYTQIGGWETFTANVQTMILLYDKNGDTVDSFTIDYNDVTNEWGIGYVDLSTVEGEHFVKVSFRYADRTVRSPESVHFIAEGEPTSDPNTGFLDFSPWFIVIIAMFAISMPIILKKHKK
ncbi:MAG: hypothetical protein GOP50_02580 [Candidatus Heimdallarchaeota archaeon]|nr:hypothetical protein [Candidatus Heimdallarchaeota archaeon]